MKKRNLKNLSLKRETISTLDSNKINGGEAMTFGIICITLSLAFECVTSECLDTFGCGPGGGIP